MILFIFRRDLRLDDNTALNEAALRARDEGAAVLPLFFLDPRQTRDNPLAGRAALTYMADSLEELDTRLRNRGSRLFAVTEPPEQALPRLLAHLKPRGVFFNRDYTPFSRERDRTLAALCRERGIPCKTSPDPLLADPDTFRTESPYRIFTPFFRAASKLPVPGPSTVPGIPFVPAETEIPGAVEAVRLREILGLPSDPSLISPGGQSEALRLLESAKRLGKYETLRDYPAVPGTTRLSAALKFGTVSVREVHAAVTESLGRDHPLIRQLWWRDFFTHVGYRFPHVFGGPFHDRFRNLVWSGSDEARGRIMAGETGFPLIDAGIRELLETGYMHNRVRMAVASFWTKDLHLDWREGELFFARYLRDYDPAVNNGNWQWAASTGCDAQPWFRIFNPWLQQKRYDPDGEYVRRWIPGLSAVPAAELHRPEGERKGYPRPLCDHKTEAELALTLYKACPG